MAAAAAPGGADGAVIRVGVVLFPGHEPLDWVGPVNLFGAVNIGKQEGDGRPRIEMLYIAESRGPVTSVTGTVTVVASHSFEDMQPPSSNGNGGGGGSGGAGPKPQLDWLLVPGGVGTRVECANPAMLRFLAGWCAPAAGLSAVMSVCTGAALLASAGALDGRRATSNKSVFDWVSSTRGAVRWAPAARWVRDGNVWTASGVSAGMDMAVAVLKQELGPAIAASAAKYAEYLPSTDADADPFADAGFVPAV